jgi:predicted Zn-dependent protease
MAAEPPSKQPVKPSPVLQAMKQELDRSMDQLKKQKTPPYFLAYDITEVDSVRVSGSFGTLTNSRRQRERLLGVDLRVGGYQLDNTRPIRGGMFNMIDSMSYIPMPVEDDPDAIRALLWYQTDQKYKRAIEQLIAVTTNNKVKIEETDRSGDFSPAPAENYIDLTAPPLKVDQKVWEDKVRKYTAPFQRYGNIYQARAALSAATKTRWFVSSDGSVIQTSDTSYQLSINGFSKADDGMELPRFETFYSSTLEGLPSDETVLAAVNKMAKDLMALKVAPVMDAYLGPAILSGRAAGVFFHEVFGHRIEAQRQKRDNDGQTFRDKVGQLVLPDFLSVYSDPTLRKLGKTELSGAYKFDDQGVKARRVPVVENGVLKNFLLSRTPLDGFPTSNGHGRKEPGRLVAARQSNLIVQASKAVSREELKKRLIEEVKKANLKYGLLFEDIMGGFTMVGRASPNAFEVLPVMVYRIYADGAEELVRGVDVVGTPLTAFSRILAADDQVATFNGTCGAESGMVPVSANSPGLLIAQLEVQKKPKSTERSPILGPPFDDR